MSCARRSGGAASSPRATDTSGYGSTRAVSTRRAARGNQLDVQVLLPRVSLLRPPPRRTGNLHSRRGTGPCSGGADGISMGGRCRSSSRRRRSCSCLAIGSIWATSTTSLPRSRKSPLSPSPYFALSKISPTRVLPHECHGRRGARQRGWRTRRTV